MPRAKITRSRGEPFADLNRDRLRAELHAQVDRLLPLPTFMRLNLRLKTAPDAFSVPIRVRVPPGTTHRALATLARKLSRLNDVPTPPHPALVAAEHHAPVDTRRG
ncbi:hypothetical protein [Deinococcus sonorensis]|uniref:Uncharacterized protein n=1 Tax=Deinococcus sonorensis TaxID=309891 RepID=A0ABV8YA72_9DEIO